MIASNADKGGLTEVQIPDDFLSKLYLGRCSYDIRHVCSSPESQYTDLNVWDRMLNMEELVSWTTCK